MPSPQTVFLLLGGLPTASGSIQGNNLGVIGVNTSSSPSDPEAVLSIQVPDWLYESSFAGGSLAVPSTSQIAISFDGSGFSGTMNPCGAATPVTYGWRGNLVTNPRSAGGAA